MYVTSTEDKFESLTQDNGKTRANGIPTTQYIKALEHSKKLTEKIMNSLKDFGKQAVIDAYFNEIIENDPLYGKALKHLKAAYEKLQENTIIKCKQKIEKKYTETAQELNKQLELVDKQKKIISGLKKELASTKINLVKETEKNSELEAGIQILLEEKEKLQEDESKLCKELKQARGREATLISWLKGEGTDGIEHHEEVNQLTQKECEYIEVGKNKIRIPRLDLSGIFQQREENCTVIECKSNSSSFIKSSIEEYEYLELKNKG